jgi:hypothetical protein
VRARLRLEGGPERVDDVFRAVVEAKLVLRELRADNASLEDIFAELTTTEAAEASEASEALPAPEHEPPSTPDEPSAVEESPAESKDDSGEKPTESSS